MPQNMSTAETISCYWIGQVSIKQLEKFLWLLEKCSQWSLPPPDVSEKDLALVRPQLTRPLPWALFIPLLALLRVWRETVSFATVMRGGEPYTASHMVKYLQNYRRTLRAVKYHGIRYRRIQKQALTAEEKETNVNKSMWSNWLSEINVFKNTETECSKEVSSPDIDETESAEKNDNQTSKKRPLTVDDDDDYIKADTDNDDDDDNDWEDDDEDDFNPDEALKELASKVEALESDPEDPDFSGLSDESSGEDSVSEDDDLDEEVLAEDQNIISNIEQDRDAETQAEMHNTKELKNSADDQLDAAKDKESNNHDTSPKPDNENNLSNKSDKLNGIEHNNGTKSNKGTNYNDNFTRNEQTNEEKLNNKKEKSTKNAEKYLNKKEELKNIEKSVSKKEELKNIEKSVSKTEVKNIEKSEDNKKESTEVLDVKIDKPMHKNNVKEVIAKISGADDEKKVQIQSSLPVYKTEKFNFNHKNNFGNMNENNVQFKDGKFTSVKSAKAKSESFLEAEKHFTEIASKAQDVCISPAIQKTGVRERTHMKTRKKKRVTDNSIAIKNSSDAKVHQEKSNENLQKN